MADVVIRGGTIVDGTGSTPYRADLAVRDGRIIEIGDHLDGARVLDASGQVVTPGFLDIHTHYDAQVFWDPALTPSSYHGVTTVVAGNCGFSIAPARPEHHSLIARTLENVEDMDVACLEAGIPWDFETFPEYLASVERHGTGINFAAFIGHTALRLYVLGDDAYHRAARPEEVEAMRAILREALLAGAAGIATSFTGLHRGVDGLPVPSRHAEPGEWDALLEVLGELGLGIAQLAPGPQCDVDRIYELQPKVGVPITYIAIMAMRNGEHWRRVDVHRRGVAAGADVWPQVSSRPLTFQFSLSKPYPLNANPVFAELMAGGVADRLGAYGDPAWRERAMRAFDDPKVVAPRWDTYRVDESATHPELLGESVEALAAGRGVSPLDVVLELAVDDSLATRIRCVQANDIPEDVAQLLAVEHTALGPSDGGAHIGQLCDAVLPTDFLGSWVRDREVMPLADAVRKLTGNQADLFGFPDRGYLRVGAAADVVVFDPDTIGPGPTRRVRDFPADAERLTADSPTGVTHVLVNGVPTRVDEAVVPEALERRPGQVVRPSRRPTAVGS